MQRCETFHSRYFYGERSHFYGKWSVNPLCYTSIYVFNTKRRATRFKVRKALNNKFACVFITCKVYRNRMLIKFTTGIIDRDPKVSESPCKIDSIHQNDSIVATRACAVATKIAKHSIGVICCSS